MINREFSSKDVMKCIADARGHIDALVGRSVATIDTLDDEATENLRAIAKLARDLDRSLSDAKVMLVEISREVKS